MTVIVVRTIIWLYVQSSIGCCFSLCLIAATFFAFGHDPPSDNPGTEEILVALITNQPPQSRGSNSLLMSKFDEISSLLMSGLVSRLDEISSRLMSGLNEILSLLMNGFVSGLNERFAMR